MHQHVRGKRRKAVWAAVGSLVTGGGLLGGAAPAQEVLPAPPAPFKGEIGLSVKDSTPDFPQPHQAPREAPNVVLVILDDVGFGATSTFGGPCSTPTLERLAKNGLRYTQFHTTALSSPTRAALLTGRNHHSVHTGVIMEQATGFPGYDSLMGKDTATVAEILRQKGWNTAWFGKNHNVPDWQNSQAGPFDLWPTGLGFEHFYGFIGAESNQWRPAAYEGTNPVEPYLGKPDYHFDDDIADRAIRWIHKQKAVAPDKPFFLYYAPGATHSPHHPRREYVEKYKGRFDPGYDRMREETFARQKALGLVPPDTRLTAPHPDVPKWDTLRPEQRQLYARMMEIYAGYLSQADHNVGRVLDAIEALGQLDNTLVIYIAGDNGASDEGLFQGCLNELATLNGVEEDLQEVLRRQDDLGTWKSHNHYPVGWAHAMCTPFQWAKQIASHFGGTRNGMVISWPARIKDRGGIRTQFHHVIDVVPTVLEACAQAAPAVVNGVAQKPVEGVSMAYSFDDPKAPSTRRTQYFEMFGNRAVYHDGWVACTTPSLAPWEDSMVNATVDVIKGYRWELYHLAEDFSEAVDLASKEPAKLEELKLLFYAEAARHNVLPLDDSKIIRLNPAIRPSLRRGRNEFVYGGPVTRIPEGAAPNIKNRSFHLAVEVELATGKESGVLVTHGGLSGGYALLVRDGKPSFHYNNLDISRIDIAAPAALSPGKHTVGFDFTYDGGGFGKGGAGKLLVNGQPVAQGRLDATIPLRFSLDETFDIGEDTGTPVNLTYDVPYRFAGRIGKVTFTLAESGQSFDDLLKMLADQQKAKE
ncbi:MAG: arylsulfatase [Acidobacteria bacterium]|nr:arylsulfatase [Acidobacteriota bacterium]